MDWTAPASTPFASRLANDISAPMLAGLLYLGAAVAVRPRVASMPLPSHGFASGGRRLGVAVLAGGLLGPLLLAAGLQRTPAATASLLLNIELAATTVLAATFFREHIGRRTWAGSAVVVLAGIVAGWSTAPTLALGAMFIVVACVCWGVDNCVTAGLDELAPEHVTLVKGLVAGTTNVVLAVVIGGRLPAGTVSLATLAHDDDAPAGEATYMHRHTHRPLVHAHPHVPDLHHRHDHHDQPEPRGENS